METELNGQPIAYDVFARELVELLPSLTRAAQCLTGSAAETDDLVQETCRRALEARLTFVKGSNMRAWLLRILRNNHVDGVRRSMREVLTGYEIDVPAPEHHPPDLWRHIALEDLESASKRLPAAARQIYSLFAVQHMSYQSISRQLGIPMATVGTRLRRARVSLRRLVLERMATESRSDERAVA